MFSNLVRIQAILVNVIIALVAAVFVLYLGFMTQHFVLFYDGTSEMFDFYKQLQVFNKEAFNIALLFAVAVGLLSLFGLSQYRPGLAGLVVALGSTIFVIIRSLALLAVIPLYRSGYLDLDFASVDFAPTTFVFDLAIWLHYLLIGVCALLAIVAVASFVQRLREGHPLIRKLI